jgi:CRISPR/Cas system endoribonuclease Cas6 (RAMP superfamily)
MIIYEFVKTLLNNEFKQICQKNMKIDDVKIIKKKKIRRKMITVDV